MLNLALKFLIFSLCIVAITACDNPYMAWSPDGTKLAFIGHDGLRFADSDGKLSNRIGIPERIAWLPDSKRLLVVDTDRVSTWAESKEYLTESQQAKAIELSRYLQERLNELGLPGLDKDPKLESEPDYIETAALMYLRDTNGPQLKRSLGKEWSKMPDLWALEIERVCVRNAAVEVDCKELWHGLIHVSDARISPDGKYVLLVQKKDDDKQQFNLDLISMESPESPIHVATSVSEHPDWSPNSRQIVFMEKNGEGSERTMMAALSCVDVRNEDGVLIKTFGKTQRLLHSLANEESEIHCLKDGRILFCAPGVELPATSNEISGIESIYTFKPGDQLARKLMTTTDVLKERSLTPIQLNPDETKAILGNRGWLSILDLATGHIEQMTMKADLPPCWRTADELCFVKPTTTAGANHHDAEIVLHSMSTGKESVLSEAWPATAVDEILIPKKVKK